MDTGEAVLALLGGHPLVTRVVLTGSRADGTAHELSDWDFLVATYDFARLTADLPRAVHPLQPLAQQWDRYSDHACYMLMLPGPAKVDLIFPDRKQAWAPPWEPSAETLVGIDMHFWDWVHWLEQKKRGGRQDALAKGLGDMHELMLGPMGAKAPSVSVDEALESYVALREQLEARYGVSVPRKLENAVRPVLS